VELKTERERLIDKMFDAALKERFSQLKRKYDPDLVFNVWTQIVKSGGVKVYFNKWMWRPKTTIQQALDCLDAYCNSIEALIQQRQGKGKGKKEREKR